MKTRFESLYATLLRLVTAITAVLAMSSLAAESRTQQAVVIQDLEPAGAAKENAGREVTWLGVATEETSEALTSQLGLKAGEGLVVTYVVPDSPAAKAGLQKNDVLVEFEGQLLVHPAQLRKLVHMRKEGDKATLTVYRAGKKDVFSVKLGKTKPWFGLLDQDALQAPFRELKRQLGDLPMMQRLRDIDKESVQLEVKRSVEEARKALQRALRQATNAHRMFGPAVREMQELVKRGVDVDKDATIIVKSHRNEVRTIVKTDDTGTYVLVASPKKHLTAHDKGGTLNFDGEIESTEQQERVPKVIWDKVQPMLEELNKEQTEEPEAEVEQGGV